MFDIQDFINEVRTGSSAYDTIARHYWEMSKDDLKRICMEFIYELEDERVDNVLEELEDCYVEDVY